MTAINISSIESATYVDSIDCYIVSDFFTHKILSFIKKSITAMSDEDWMPMQMQEDRPRIELSYNTTLFKMISGFASEDQILYALSNKLDRKVTFDTVSVCKDTAGYELPLHVDTASYNIGIQIYLTDKTILDLGTSFGDSIDRVLFTLPYRDNSGYFMPNADQTHHGLLTAVPKDVIRYSILMRYSYE